MQVRYLIPPCITFFTYLPTLPTSALVPPTLKSLRLSGFPVLYWWDVDRDEWMDEWAERVLFVRSRAITTTSDTAFFYYTRRRHG